MIAVCLKFLAPFYLLFVVVLSATVWKNFNFHRVRFDLISNSMSAMDEHFKIRKLEVLVQLGVNYIIFRREL